MTALMIVGCRSKDQNEITDLYNDAYKALRAKEYRRLSELLDSKTLAYYETLRKLTISKDVRRLKATGLMAYITYLGVKDRINEDALKEMSAKDFFVSCYGENAKKGMRGGRIDDIDVTGDRATCTIVAKDGSKVEGWTFYREDGVWKFNVVDLLERMETEVVSRWKSTGGTVDSLYAECESELEEKNSSRQGSNDRQ
jgi:hypothetical protein